MGRWKVLVGEVERGLRQRYSPRSKNASGNNKVSRIKGARCEEPGCSSARDITEAVPSDILWDSLS